MLGAVGDPRDLDLLCSAVRPGDKRADLDPDLAQDFQDAVAKMLSRNEIAYVLIKTCLRIEPAATRRALFAALADTLSEAGLEELGLNLGIRPDEDRCILEEMRRAAALVPLPVRESIPDVLRPRLVEDDASRLVLAIECLGDLEDPDAVTALVPLLRHADPDVGRAAHAALRSITGIELIGDPTRWKGWIRSETEWFTAEAPRLAAELRSGDEPARASAVAAMAAHPLHRRELAEILSVDLPHASPAVRDITLAALGQLGGAHCRQSLERCAQGPDRELAAAARHVLDRLPPRPTRSAGAPP